jgi:hypothetical protein
MWPRWRIVTDKPFDQEQACELLSAIRTANTETGGISDD